MDGIKGRISLNGSGSPDKSDENEGGRLWEFNEKFTIYSCISFRKVYNEIQKGSFFFEPSVTPCACSRYP